MSDAGDNGNDAPTYPNQPLGILGNVGFDPARNLGPDEPSILGPALHPKPWTLADSTIHGLLSPEDIATIDFGDIGQPQPSQPSQLDASGVTGLTPWQPDPDAAKLFQSGLNGHGYTPQAGDENTLARIIYAEASNTPSDMPAIGWSVVNRVGDPEFGKTLDAVINQKNQFSSVQDNSKQWRGSADPDSLTGPNAKAWRQAQDTAQGILNGGIPDPVDGGAYFFSSSSYKNGQDKVPGGFQNMLHDYKIVPVNPPGGGGTNNYFFKRNPYPPKNG